MNPFAKKRDTIHLDDEGAREFIHGMGVRLGRALDHKIMKELEPCWVRIRELNDEVRRLQHMTDTLYKEAHPELFAEDECKNCDNCRGNCTETACERDDE